MQTLHSYWTPGSGVTNNTGEPVNSDMIFYVSPPPEIGEIYTAHSGLRMGKESLYSPVFWIWTVVMGLLGSLILGAMAEMTNVPLIGLGLVIGMAAGAAIGIYQSKRNKGITFTGSNGIARYIYGETAGQGKVFQFANAVELRTAQTRQYTNGVYTGTSFYFTWSGPDGKAVHKIQGSYRSEKGTPNASSLYWYALAAELAWSRHLWNIVYAELERSGIFRFNLRNNNYVIAGPGYLQLHLNGKDIVLPVQDIASMEVNQGVLTVKHKDAKSGFLGIGSSGIFSFNYADLANARVFMMLLDKLVCQ